MSAESVPGSKSLLSAVDLFGKTDAGGVEKFKAIAFRALHEQKLDEELKQTKQENEVLKDANARLARDLKELQISFDANIDDRERVLAFKSKRIEELHSKLHECEIINALFMQAINGKSSESDLSTSNVQSNSTTFNHSIVGSVALDTDTRTKMMALITAGKPVFHACDTCKEQEYKQLYEESQRKLDQLVQTSLEHETVFHENRLAEFHKRDSDIQIEQLQAQIVAMTLEKNELGHHFERKLLLEQDKVRQEKESEIEALHEMMRAQMLVQLDVTTQRTVEENERVQLELRYQSLHLEKMMKRIDTLEDENKHMKQERHLVEEINTGLSKKVKVYEHLLSKTQQSDNQWSMQVDSQEQLTEKPPIGPLSSRRIPRKPPIPALSLRNSKLKSPDVPSSCSLESPNGSYFLPEINSYQTTKSSLITEFQSPCQLNDITDILDKHLQTREFTKKQVVAALRYHHDQYRCRDSPNVARNMRMGTALKTKRKLMVSKVCYLSTNHGRRMREPPITLDSLIKYKLQSSSLSAESTDSNHVKFNEEQRQKLHDLLLPDQGRNKQKDKPTQSLIAGDLSEVWKRSRSRWQDDRLGRDPPATSRF
ncbi:putative cilia-and flagella-associated protein [Plasmopara halstedii]